jgi:hypothetical protein
MNKINSKIQDQINKLIELQDYESRNDFDTREGKICANIKVYDWLDEGDVIAYIDKEYPGADKTQILDEFNDDRLNSIHSHTCEMEVSNLKEKYEGNADVSNFYALFKTYHQSNNTEGRSKEFYIELYPKNKYYIETYWDKAKEFKTIEEFKKHILKQDAWGYNEFFTRDKIDKFECWQYGRSGGWFSICSEDEVDFSRIIGDNFGYWLEDMAAIDSDKEFNLRLSEVGEDKKDLLKRIKEAIKNAEEKIEAIKQIVVDIEYSKKYFKESLLVELHHEIDEFIAENSVELKSNCTIEVADDRVKTSLGVSVNLKEFTENLAYFAPQFKAMKEGEEIKINKKVGNYIVERAKKIEGGDVIIKAGVSQI